MPHALTLNDRVSKWLYRAHPATFVLATLALSYLVMTPLIVYGSFFEIPSGSPDVGKNLGRDIFTALVVAPLIETALNQALPIFLLRKYTKLPRVGIIVISAAIFGALHSYSSYYIVTAFLIGLVLAYAYYVRRRPGGHPYLLVTLAHALRNTFALVAIYTTGA